MSDRAVPEVRRALATRVRELRRARRMTQEALGKSARLSGKFIGEVERAEKSISLDSLAGVARALGVPMTELLAATDGKANPDAERIYALARTARTAKLRHAYEVLRAALGRS